MERIPSSEPLVGWQVWSLFSLTIKNPAWHLKSRCESEPLPPRIARVAGCKERVQQLNQNFPWDVDAYWEKSLLEPFPFTLDIVCPDVPTVFGEVVGWGNVVGQDWGWCASRTYPLRIAVICFDCLIDEGVLHPAKEVSAYWTSLGGYNTGIARCSEHALERAYQRMPGDLGEDRVIPARDVEAELLARYGVGRADLPMIKEHPSLFLSEMNLEDTGT